MQTLTRRLLVRIRPLLAAALLAPLMAQATMVRMFTTLGPIDVNLMDAEAPLSVTNFLAYVDSSAYINTFFHRAPKNFVVQGGGYSFPVGGTASHIPTRPPIALEFSNTRPNARGTIAMARTSELNSATSEWFINTVDNTTTLGAANGGGYAVFGKITVPGMAVADAIAALTIVNAGGAFATLPVLPSWTSGTVQRTDLVFITRTERIPTRTRDADRAFDALEAAYWKLLKPGFVSNTLTFKDGDTTYLYRNYPSSGAYLAVNLNDNSVLYLVPELGPSFVRFASLPELMPTVGAFGY